jgi:hypothetical protein
LRLLSGFVLLLGLNRFERVADELLAGHAVLGINDVEVGVEEEEGVGNGVNGICEGEKVSE